MVLRYTNVLIHVESLHIFEAHFACLVRLEGNKQTDEQLVIHSFVREEIIRLTDIL